MSISKVSSSPSKQILVLLTLYGGYDGLNTVIPYQSQGYESQRLTLAIDGSTVLPLSDGFGLHPSTGGFKKLWDANHLAIVQGVGFANPNISHFQSMDIWQSGVSGEPVSTGWLGRWLDATNSSPLRAVSIGPIMPTVLSGAKVRGAAIPPGTLFPPGNSQEQSLISILSQTSPGEASLLSEAAQANENLLQLSNKMGAILARTVSSDPLNFSGSTSADLNANGGAALAAANGGGGQSSPNVLATQLSIVTNLILAGAFPRVYSVELGGFDRYADQLETQTKLLDEMDVVVSAFVNAFSGTSLGNGVVAMVYSEFGRRVSANLSAGTDHGWANNVFLAGPGVKGGFYGDPPSLTKLQQGNLVFTTDFRSVYATIFDKVLGVDPKSFLCGSFKPLPMM